jgi:K+-sensing histidine kinase KdpD
MTTATNWTNISNVEGLLTSANNNSPFWLEMLIMFWIVAVITLLRYGFMTAVLAGSFVIFIIGLFLVYMGLVAWQFELAVIAIIISAIIYDLFFGRDDA